MTAGWCVVDVGAWKVTQELRFPAGGGSMHGIVFSADGGTLYATTAQAALWEATRGDGGGWAWRRKVALPGPGGRGELAPLRDRLGGDGRTAYVCLSRSNTLGVVDLEKGELAGRSRSGSRRSTSG